MTQKTCPRCKRNLVLEVDFYLSSPGWCKNCVNEDAMQRYHKDKSVFADNQRNYRENNREKVNKSQREYRRKSDYATRQRMYRESNPLKYKAHNAVSNAVRDKNLIKPRHCELCSKEKRLEAHHWHGYDEEYWLDVQWLCKQCHTISETQSA